MSRKIIIETCGTCPFLDHKGGFGAVSYIPICRMTGEELPYTVNAASTRLHAASTRRPSASPSYVIPLSCPLEVN